MIATDSRLVLVGFGNMGRALVDGWLANGLDPAQITVVDPASGADARAVDLGVCFARAPGEVPEPADIVVLAVKPAQIESAVRGLPAAGLYVSIAAGRSLGDLEQAIGNSNAAVVRAMPNTPAAIGQGVTGLCANALVTAVQKAEAARLMSAVGSVEWLDDESLMDALTAVSGSGPAYVFLLIECLTSAGIKAGLPAELAERLATQTVSGAGAYAAVAAADAATLREQVTSPNGTTAAALSVLRDGDALKTLLEDAVAAAANRSRELGKAS